MIAAYAAKVRVRIHTFQGEVWASKRGPVRGLLKSLDRLVAKLATHRLVVGRGEQAFLEEEAVLAIGNSTVLASGSIVGVDLDRFKPNPGARARVRAELSVPEGGLLVMYLGRMGREKGVLDLAQAFYQAADYVPLLHLIYVGPDEEGVRPALESAIGERRDRLRFVGYTRTPERYLASADILCLPSYREGFNVSLIEAGACGLPVIASRLYGTTDAVVNGLTGILHEPGDVAGLAAAVSLLASNSELRRRMGAAGRKRAETHFRSSILLAALRSYYASVFSASNV
jgi:glycosyltransferase involved in cell wall biosynthesis